MDAGYEQESPYFGWPDMQKFSAVSGALTKLSAPPADPNAWQSLYQYNGHIFEADDSYEILEENFQGQIQIERTGPLSFLSIFTDEGYEMPLNDEGTQLRWSMADQGLQTSYEDENFKVQTTSEMEDARCIQLGSGRILLVWFGQSTHQLTVKSGDVAPGPYPSIRNAFAEADLLVDPSIPFGPVVPPDSNTDFDDDGVPDLLEFAFNLNNAVADRRILTEATGTSGLPAIRLERTTSPARLRVEYLRRKDAAALGISYEVQWSSDLTSWATGAATTQVTPVDDQWERVVVTDPFPGLSRFGRVEVKHLANP